MIVLGIVALLAPVMQAALMGVVGYPLARRRGPDGMARFHRSGFTWWLVTLALLAAAGTVAFWGALPSGPLAGHPQSWARLFASASIGFVAMTAVESLYEVLSTRHGGRRYRAERERYESAVPDRLRNGPLELVLLGLVGVLEEYVYRGFALYGLLELTGGNKPVAAGLTAVGFGAAHWYYGWRQVWLKSLDGAVLAAVALSAGWPASALVHGAVNVALATMASISRRRAEG